MTRWEYLAGVLDARGVLWNDTIRIYSRNRRWLRKLQEAFPMFKGPYPVGRSYVIVCNKKEDVEAVLKNCLAFSLEGKLWLASKTFAIS